MQNRIDWLTCLLQLLHSSATWFMVKNETRNEFYECCWVYGLWSCYFLRPPVLLRGSIVGFFFRHYSFFWGGVSIPRFEAHQCGASSLRMCYPAVSVPWNSHCTTHSPRQKLAHNLSTHIILKHLCQTGFTIDHYSTLQKRLKLQDL